MKETGTWCETTDSEMHFTVQSIHGLMKSPAFTAAAMSLASRQLDYLDRRERPLTLELYQHTIQLLLSQDTRTPGESVLAACTLLCVYEMMASEVHEWRRHLKGCAGLLQAQRWTGSAQGIVKSCFWAFARIDIWAAFITGKTTLIPTDFWLDDTSVESVRGKGNIDDYCNLAILLFARIVNLLSTPGSNENGYHRSGSVALMSSLWKELQKWYRLRPPEVCPLLEDYSPSKIFPAILFSRSSFICGNTFYHTGCILLLQTGAVPVGTSQTLLGDMDNVMWHSRRLAGISMSNSSHANWVNELQPMYIVGTVFAQRDTPPNAAADGSLTSLPGHMSRPFIPTTRNDPVGRRASAEGPSASWESEDDYPAEKLLILKHLSRIERETGWKTSDRAAALRSLWGLG
ncbi:uncharacterized protein BDV17DRAFT_145245 [Aspergillus undulatus]|uniref:uncharacterized protein n=1 Tax=Aspergillus undulatus TaxID=1810928 RepID=UPI003CCCE6AB